MKQTSFSLEQTESIDGLIPHIRETLLATEDTVSLERARRVTAAYRRHADDPTPVRRARAFAHVLRSMTLDLATNPVFAGNTAPRPRAWMLVPEHGFREPPQIVHEHPHLRGILEGAIPQDLRDAWEGRSVGGTASVGHLAVDYERVVREGLDALLAEARARAHEGTPEQRTYRRAMAIALQAVIDWAGRYAEAAEAAAQRAHDPVIRACHRRVAAACRHVPARPARTLFEGLQAIALVHLAITLEGHGLSVSIGLPDRALAHLLDAGAAQADETTALVAAFLLKIAANSIFGSGSKTQAITVGGLDHRGRDRCNALTLAFLEAADRVRVGDPHVFLRWHAGIDAEVKGRAVAMLAAGVSMPLLIHDEPTAQGFLNAGVRPEDAWDYCVIGCNELGIPGRSAESATARNGTIQHLALLNATLLEHPNPDALDMDALLAALEARMHRRALEMYQRGQASIRRAADRVPTPFTSALMRGCVERGMDLRVGMAYHLPGVYERGLTNAVNALAAIQRLVFEARVVTLSEFVQALREDYEGHAALRARVRQAPKWGTGDPQADRWADVLVAMRERALDAADAQTGTGPHMVCHVVRSLHYFDGRRIAASPDGRKAWAPVADSIGAETGTAHAGPTGVLNSVLKLDVAQAYRGGTNLNLTLPAARWSAPEMQETLLALVETFFAQGGQEVQISTLDPDVLRDAQARPERHGDLIVRVAGFNARFVDLAPVEQEELIHRAEAAI